MDTFGWGVVLGMLLLVPMCWALYRLGYSSGRRDGANEVLEHGRDE